MNIQQAIAAVTAQQNLSGEQMQSVMRQIMTGECTPAQIGGLLIGLAMKGETVEEITAAAEVMISLADQVDINAQPLIDIVGTGGDGLSTFNVSTAASFVAAGAGVKVAKHGNRSVSSSSGSADLLEHLGANLNLEAAQVVKVVERAGVGFMFAPMHHSAMKYAIGPRQEMGVRTLFNVLGPLTNPAGVKRQVVGVYSDEHRMVLAQVLANLGSEHALVVRGKDNMDEISICAPTKMAEYKEGSLHQFEIRPEDFGLKTANVADLIVDGPSESLTVINGLLEGKVGAPRDIVVLNAGAAIYVAGIVDSIADGVSVAQQSLDNGKAAAARDAYIKATVAFK